MLTKVKSGFTLIEILVAVAIVGILSTIMIVSVNPGRQLAKARDTERQTHLVGILSAILQYSQEHSGDLPDTDGDPATSNFPTTATCIGTDVSCFDLAGAGETGETIVPVFMVAMPEDPKYADPTDPQSDTGYTIYVDVNGRLHTSAVGEITNPITVDR
ncbi:hypothetical protein A2714_05465 [Candidatus Woesebacteria bacterium RIFCSPHIGHO2_01_FULL_38_9]|uniref:Type II secretion system protein GspG C-terminal domain-containing protein n=2 Tax=Candidatus Woeseibacteriota TaxID=1752722 RepID=A0A1F7Y1S7_9BACT|nr:MAG: hypothetical protein A2714_05465 [Candidatus Woesebacteria bacterium RIFCSPHIGHO2_01_FULL_38_9]OGM60917.1 MAG: hypothetical protein A3A75_02400 [Candidatus Woesebacteria bacterium RIFCSPLOWO2_01_FULL_39_10]